MSQPCGADIIMLQCLQAGYFRHLQTFSDIINVIVKKQNNNVADLCVLPSARSINGCRGQASGRREGSEGGNKGLERCEAIEADERLGAGGAAEAKRVNHAKAVEGKHFAAAREAEKTAKAKRVADAKHVADDSKLRCITEIMMSEKVSPAVECQKK
jgi:hypothetical protein